MLFCLPLLPFSTPICLLSSRVIVSYFSPFLSPYNPTQLTYHLILTTCILKVIVYHGILPSKEKFGVMVVLIAIYPQLTMSQHIG
jgi:hypothetical protein